MILLRRLLFVIGILAVPTINAQAALVWGFRSEMINDGGADTASVIVTATADANQVANAGSIEDIGVNSLNVQVNFGGGLSGGNLNVVATNLVPFPTTIWLPGPNANAADGATATVSAAPLGSAPTFASLVAGGSTFDVMKLDLSVSDGFEDGVDESSIKLTVVSGSFPSQTQLGKIGSLDEPFLSDPLYATEFGGMTTLSIVPEPSSFLLVGLVIGMVGGVKWYKNKKRNG